MAPLARRTSPSQEDKEIDPGATSYPTPRPTLGGWSPPGFGDDHTASPLAQFSTFDPLIPRAVQPAPQPTIAKEFERALAVTTKRPRAQIPVDVAASAQAEQPPLLPFVPKPAHGAQGNVFPPRTINLPALDLSRTGIQGPSTYPLNGPPTSPQRTRRTPPDLRNAFPTESLKRHARPPDNDQVRNAANGPVKRQRRESQAYSLPVHRQDDAADDTDVEDGLTQHAQKVRRLRAARAARLRAERLTFVERELLAHRGRMAMMVGIRSGDDAPDKYPAPGIGQGNERFFEAAIYGVHD